MRPRHRAEVDTLRPQPEFDSPLRDEHRLELGGVLDGAFAWCWPTQNVVYADDQGHIAYHAVGRVPIRPGELPLADAQDAQHEWHGYIPFDDHAQRLRSALGLSGHRQLARDHRQIAISAHARVDGSVSHRAHLQILQGRDGLNPKDMIAVQTDIYSEVDQELAHRFAYAIDHASDADDRLRKAADILRSWDGRLTTDSAAASLVTQARCALRTMILEPKLGDLAENTAGPNRTLPRKRSSCTPAPIGFRRSYKDWDALLTDAVRRGMETRPKPRRREPMDLRNLARGRHRASAGQLSALSSAASPVPARSRSAATPRR